jgi:hypothetical protein
MGTEGKVSLLTVNTTADSLSPDYMSVSMGTKDNGNLFEMPAHPRYVE